MYFTLIKKELLHNLLTLRFALVTILLVIMATGTTAVRTAMFNRIAETHREAVRAFLDTEAKQVNYWNTTFLGHVIKKAPAPLSIFAGGLEEEMTRSVRFIGSSPWSPIDLISTELGRREYPVAALRIFLSLDLVTLIAVVCSLLAMLLVFDTISAERENGTLRILLAGPLPRDIVITAKLTAGYLTILIPLLMAWAAGITCVTLLLREHLDAGDLARLGLIVALSALYIAVFFAAGMAASAWSRRSATALGVCLTAWIVMALAIPNLVPLAVRRFCSVPSSVKISLELENIERNIWTGHVTGWQKELAARGVADWERQFPLLRQKGDALFLAEAGQMERYQQARLKDQVNGECRAARTSPTAAFTFAATMCAGTGPGDYLRYLDILDRYRSEYIRARYEQWSGWVKSGYDPAFHYDPALFPPFAPTRRDTASLLNVVWPDFVILLAMTVGLFFIAYVGFMKREI